MAHLTRSILIAASPQAVFEFHADPRNIERVASPPARAELLQPYEVPLRRGSVVRLKVSILGLVTQVVESEIIVCDPPREFVDVQRRGPFRAWHHRHLFAEVEGGTELTDDVDYELPTCLPYRLFPPQAMTEVLENLFARRQQLTKALIEGGSK